ncbi:hypothetical protein SKA58_19670 [Sphingomonas sp. SKA58]|jgi:hypothetical protein|uniref:hypothetical protein n=1 Tax=Sphingomonas sp. (strain SKA58) TaxID=314266 RepID=UPI0000D7AA91|nr:hypothetical protein [Sphingomonas sp. SKA58]EAT07483.1 hypothetical protein SKA58_19670 [Sphingomonas sp. SKA58]
MAYLVALYRVDRAYGGPEEGSWYYDCGELERIVRACPSEASANAVANRLDRLLDRLQARRPDVSSVLYDGSRFSARVYAHRAPPFFPEQRPVYE